MAENMFNVGKIINTHGIRGDVKVLRITDFDDRLQVGKTIFLALEDKQPLPLTIDGHRIHKGFDLLHFEGYNSIDDVEHFKGSYLKITEQQLTRLEDGEYYYHEIIGCQVFLNDGNKLGTVKEILSPGANDVWVVKQLKGKDILIPYIDQIVKEINIEEKRIVVELMEGLLE